MDPPPAKRLCVLVGSWIMGREVQQTPAVVAGGADPHAASTQQLLHG
jgi:hypothetical protein